MKFNYFALIVFSLLSTTVLGEGTLCAKGNNAAKPAAPKVQVKAKPQPKVCTTAALYEQCIELLAALQQETQTAATRTGQANAIIILQGLSQSCAHLGQIAGAQTKPEKQQGAFNILSTIFDTAARLTGPTNPLPPSAAPAPAQPRQQVANDQTTRAIVELADQLVTYTPKEQEYKSKALSLPLIALVKKARHGNLHKIFIKKMLQSKYPGKRFLQELLQAVNEYLTETLQALKGPHLNRNDRSAEGKKNALARARMWHALEQITRQLMPQLQENVMAHYEDVWNTERR